MILKHFPPDIDTTIQHSSQRRPKSGNIATRGMLIQNFFSTQQNNLNALINEEVASPRQQEPSMIAPNEDQHDMLSRCEESMLNFNPQSKGQLLPLEVVEKLVESLQAKHKAEKDSLLVEI